MQKIVSRYLATLTEKFYGSWAFRIAGGMLVVAALFAVAGSLAIGGLTFNLRQDLEQSADRAKKDIGDRQQSTAVELDRRMKALEKTAGDATEKILSLKDSTALAITSAGIELNRGRDDFAKKIEDGQKDLKAMSDSFKSYSIELKERAVVQAVAAVQASLKEQESGIKEEILTPLRQIRDKDIADLHKTIKTVSEDIGQAKKDVGQVRNEAKDQQDALNALGPDLNQLRSLVGQSDQIARRIESIKTGELTVREAAGKTADHTRSAGKAAADAEQSRRSVSSVLTKVNDEGEVRLRQLGTIEFRFRTLENSIASLENATEQEKARINKVKQGLGDVDQSQDMMRNLRERLASLQPEVNTVGTRIEKASGVLDRAEPALWNIAQAEVTIRWMQERLAALQAAIDQFEPETDAVPAVLERGKKLNVELGRVEDAVKTVRKRLDQLQTEIEMLAQRIKEASTNLPVPSPGGEDKLTLEGWKMIQEALTALGHNPGPH